MSDERNEEQLVKLVRLCRCCDMQSGTADSKWESGKHFIGITKSCSFGLIKHFVEI
jgi:hypothetical protein